MQVALYARVSTPNQQQEGTLASQVRSLQHHIRQQGWSLLPDHEYLDEGISGARLDRPALDRLHDCAQRGEFDAAAVLSPDRLARNYAHQWFLIEEFTKLHMQVIFLQNLFGDTPQGELLTQMQKHNCTRSKPAAAVDRKTSGSGATPQPSSRVSCSRKPRCNYNATPSWPSACINLPPVATCCGDWSNVENAGWG